MFDQVNGQQVDRKIVADIVIRKLKAHENPDDIIFEVCNLTAWDWQDAHRFIENVATERKSELNTSEMWISLLVGGAFTLVGLSGMSLSLMYFFGFDPLLDVVRDVNLVAGFASLQGLVISLLAGLSMVAGGIIGIVKGLRLMGAGF